MRRPDRPVAAVRIALDMDGFAYRKWGGEQYAKSGDWLVDADGDVHTVDAEVFARTYRKAASGEPGAYIKVTPVWAERTEQAGEVRTKEGITHYAAGDYLVANNSDGTDAYAVPRDKFESLYVLDE